MSAADSATPKEFRVHQVLFVDDEPNVLAGLVRATRPARGRWAARFAVGAEAALQMLAVEPADAVVTDFRMPGMDGARLLAEIRSRYPGTARLVLSGHTEDKDLATLASLAHQFLAKPCDPGQLIAAVDRALRRRETLDDGTVLAEVTALGHLPIAPAVLAEFASALDLPGCAAATIADIVEGDVGLAAKILQLVNSSFFAPGARVTSVEQAVTRLGPELLRALLSRSDVLLVCEDMTAATQAELHAISRRGLAAARLARQVSADATKDDAFCAGLLHEVGRLALFPWAQRAAERTIAMTHPLIGAYALSLWGFPSEVVDAVAAQDRRPTDLPFGPPDTTAALQIACFLGDRRAALAADAQRYAS